MQAIHFICRRDDGISLNNLSFDKAAKRYRSGHWDISEDEASALVGGWVYLHAVKSSPSEFGGVVEGFHLVTVDGLTHAARVVLIVEKRNEGAGQRWRGRGHGMAHSGGLVDADLKHEGQAHA